jgi:hypothetical protein
MPPPDSAPPLRAAPKNASTINRDFSRLPTPQCFYFPPLSSFLSLQVPLAAAAGT